MMIESLNDDTQNDYIQNLTMSSNRRKRPVTCSSVDRFSMERTSMDSLKMMASLRRHQLEVIQQQKRFEEEVKELNEYSKFRFLSSTKLERSKTWTSMPMNSNTLISPSATMHSKSQLSFATTYDENNKSSSSQIAIPYEHISSDEDRLLGRRKNALMNTIRTTQRPQTVNYYHDRLAQEMSQEGKIISDKYCYPCNWPDRFTYRITPKPALENEICNATQWQEYKFQECDKLEDEDEEDNSQLGEDAQQLSNQVEIKLEEADNKIQIELADSVPSIQLINPTQNKQLTVAGGGTRRNSTRRNSTRKKSMPEKKRQGAFSVSSLGSEEKAANNRKQQDTRDVIQRIVKNREETERKRLEEIKALKAPPPVEVEKHLEPEPTPAVSPVLSSRKSSGKKKSASAKKTPNKRTSSGKSTISKGSSSKGRKKSPRDVKKEVKILDEQKDLITTTPIVIPVPDSIDIAIKKMLRLKINELDDNNLPKFSCPSSEFKSREYRTKQWWSKTAFTHGLPIM